MSEKRPVRFVFGLHLHQPVGNFDHVFEAHAADVYRPLVKQLARHELRPVLLHISGPLIEWLEQHDHALLDDIARLVADQAIEPLLGGMYEPILASLPRRDRVEQIAWHRESLTRLFGVDPTGLWLTERVWEPDLPADLAEAGVEYVLVDDRHFLISGYDRDELHVPFRTEADGRAVSVLAIDERLRYSIPFQDPSATADLLRSLRDSGAPLAVYADDGEKFGGWPGTKDLVYGRGWFDRFCDMIGRLRDEGVVEMASGRHAVRDVPSRGPVYLPTASYKEMEGWSLPAEASRRLTALERDLGGQRMAGPDGALVRGAHWRNFLAKYTEANRLHKKMVALSALSRQRGDPLEARRAVGRAQCNDAYWHGVFGGLYLPHLRGALWRQLAIAEGMLRSGERLDAEMFDLDQDGADEVWVHSSSFSAIVAPARGGAIVEYSHFPLGINYADVLTRRREAYHLPPLNEHQSEHSAGSVASIHDLESGFGLSAPPPVDLDDRAIGVARVLAAGLTQESYSAARFAPVASWARARCDTDIVSSGECLEVRCRAPGFSVTWSFTPNGRIQAAWAWDGSSFGDGDRFAPEMTFASTVPVNAPSALAIWRDSVETYAKSERGLERVRQGESVTPLFDARTGGATLALFARE
ncbi:MAG TPA: alpha-amylase/4-alpha-glucanotransferase domain-containing protein [Gemmatimonadaceae bacterium]|jgi:alpha-amylase|nr:alpha-amylase/4-alpha-glucanotransferase domain-containing protein [Gemmatimonadaceae bacterium]